MKRLLLLLAGCLLCSRPAHAQGYSIQVPSLHQVQIKDGFWSPRLATHRTVTLPHTFQKCEETGRIQNFEVAAGRKEGHYTGVYPFNDSDVYKAIEGAAYVLMQQPDVALETYVDALITLIGEAQEPDGYLYTWRTTRANPADTIRWSNIRWGHELYNMGHLYEAAVAWYEATGKRNLLNIALKNAALVERTFGPGKLEFPPGHQQIERGLVKLYQVTRHTPYLNLARYFIDERGQYNNGREGFGAYAQDHQPLLQQDEVVGHAVRAAYYFAAAADVAALDRSEPYATRLKTLWMNAVSEKLYITGGTGAVGFGERYGAGFELPNLSAYAETCSSIGNVFWHERMFRLTGESFYVDALERTLYNALLSGYGLEGNRFFYPNVLASRGFTERFDWFVCPCCVTNLARFIPTLPSYLYAYTDQDVYVNLYAGSTATLPVGGQQLTILQQTRYPWEGQVRLAITVETPVRFALRLRLPGWVGDTVLPGDLYRFLDRMTEPVRITLNGQAVAPLLDRGYAVLDRTWQSSDRVEFTLPMPVRQIAPNPRLSENTGMLALQRGPLVYALEGPDQPDGQVLNRVVTAEAPITPQWAGDVLGGLMVLRGPARSISLDAADQHHETPTAFTAIPYYAWAHRGMAEMTVWIPTDPARATPLHARPLATRATVESSDRRDATQVQAPTVAHTEAFVWQDTSQTVWVQYTFSEPQDISAAEVQWYDDGRDVRPPVSWRVLALVEGRWEVAYTPYGNWGTASDRPNRTLFETFRARTIRLEVQPRVGKKAGLRQWQVY